jgi:uncharacterized membrane protein
MGNSPDLLHERRYRWATLIIVALYIAAFCIFTIGRYERYNATGYDLAFYDQIIWRTAHTDVMGVSIEGDNVSNWAFHVEPILLLLAPLSLIFQDTRWLLVLQSVALGIAAIPIYRIALRQWQKPWIGFLFAGLYLIYPAVGFANKFDFHPLTLTMPLLLFAWDSAELKRYPLTSVLLLLALMCKEEMGFVVAGFGLYWYFEARWRTGLIWAVGGVIWALVSLFVIIPGAQGKTLLPNQAFLRYSWLFKGSLAEKIAYITGSDTPLKVRFLIQLFTPLLFMPLLKPKILAIAVPILVLSLLSAQPDQSGIFHQYMADILPFLMIAAIKGTYSALSYAPRLRLRRVALQRVLLVGMLASTLIMFIAFNPFVFVPRFPYSPVWGWEPGASLDGLRAAEKMIPPDSCLTTANNIAAHYGQRKYIYVFGIGNWKTCDLSMVDLANTRFADFGSPQEMACKQFGVENYHPVFFQDNVVILKRDAPINTDYNAQLKAYCVMHGYNYAVL